MDDLFDIFDGVGEGAGSGTSGFWVVVSLIATIVFALMYFVGNVPWALVAFIISGIVLLISGFFWLGDVSERRR